MLFSRVSRSCSPLFACLRLATSEAPHNSSEIIRTPAVTQREGQCDHLWIASSGKLLKIADELDGFFIDV